MSLMPLPKGASRCFLGGPLRPLSHNIETPLERPPRLHTTAASGRGDRGSREAGEATGRTWQNRRGARGQGKQREVSRLTGATTMGCRRMGKPREASASGEDTRVDGGARGACEDCGEGKEGVGGGGTRIARQDVGSHSPMGNVCMPTGQIAVHGLINIYAVSPTCNTSIPM